MAHGRGEPRPLASGAGLCSMGTLSPAAKAAAAEEIADVLLYLVRLGDQLGIDLAAAAQRKLAANAQKYPVDKARGSNKKYTEL